MSKMSELDTAITELRRCGEALIDVADTLRALFSGEADETATDVQPDAHVYTLEEVRAILMAKNRAGFKDEVKALLHSHGADRLPDIDPSEYAALVAEAEGLGNG